MEEKLKINKENFNPKVRPQDDFFEYANGGWLKNNKIPSDQSMWGSFYKLSEDVQVQLKGLLDELLESDPSDNEEKIKIINFYKSGMDEEKINKEGHKPLLPYFDRIKNINLENISAEIAAMQRIGYFPFFWTTIAQDEKDALSYIPYLIQGGLGMPDRDYYLKTDIRTLEIQDKYKKFISKTFYLLGHKDDEINNITNMIFNFEKNLAEVSMDRVTMRDPYKTYHKKSLNDLKSELPKFNWESYFNSFGIPIDQNIILCQPDFFSLVAKYFSSESELDNIKLYLKWSITRTSASILSDEFSDLSFEFYSKALTGVTEQKPRSRRVLSNINSFMGFSLGKVYVEKYFSENAKLKMQVLVKDITDVMEDHIRKVSWMTDETKENALKKLKTFIPKLGYPDVWRDYSSLPIGESYFENIINADIFEMKRQISKLGSPLDRTEWEMSPQTVNAYYQPSMNEIVFPAAILQPPFFSENSEVPLNYGGIGSVIAHEITHGFDDWGSKYDENGNLKEWWTKEDREKFDEKTKLLIEQFNSIYPFPGVHINGELTLGENIADLGGVILAYDAYMKSLEGKEIPEEIDRLTHIERFFLRFAECECTKAREEAAHQRLIVDPHSPSKYRVNAILSHFEPFYEAFGIKEGDGMYLPPEMRAKIW